MKIAIAITSLIRNQSGPSGAHGPSQPPKKSVIASAERVIMFTYSAIWNRPQRMPEYSVWYPATSSLSASGRSNGALAVSATAARKKTTKPTNCGATNHCESICLVTMAERFSEWPMRKTPSTESESDTSYDTSCAQVRIDPRSEYFESDAHPPTMNPYTPTEPSAKKRISPIDTFETTPLMK